MGLYASSAQVTAELAGHDLDLPDDLDGAIRSAERAVDRRLGPYPTDPVTGLKLTPLLLSAAQRAALVRAVAVAVGNLAQLDAEEAFGVGDWLPAGFTPVRGSGVEPLIDAALAGHDLLQRSGCALPDPERVFDDGLPA